MRVAAYYYTAVRSTRVMPRVSMHASAPGSGRISISQRSLTHAIRSHLNANAGSSRLLVLVALCFAAVSQPCCFPMVASPISSPRHKRAAAMPSPRGSPRGGRFGDEMWYRCVSGQRRSERASEQRSGGRVAQCRITRYAAPRHPASCEHIIAACLAYLV